MVQSNAGVGLVLGCESNGGGSERKRSSAGRVGERQMQCAARQRHYSVHTLRQDERKEGRGACSINGGSAGWAQECRAAWVGCKCGRGVAGAVQAGRASGGGTGACCGRAGSKKWGEGCELWCWRVGTVHAFGSGVILSALQACGPAEATRLGSADEGSFVSVPPRQVAPAHQRLRAR